MREGGSIVSRPLKLTYEEYEKQKKKLIGLTIDEYSVKSQLGKGQFGTVYLAQNPWGHKFALKVIDLREIAAEVNPRIRAIR